jgi:sarcosine oxidase
MPGGRVAIIGGGINGAATAWALARRGVDVTLHEQFDRGHARGSSHGRSRIWRLAYPERHWVELAREGLEGWRELEREAGETLLETTGLLEFAAEEQFGSGAALAAAGIRCETPTPGEIHDRFGIRVPPGWTSLWQPEAGWVRADRALEAFLRVAAGHGARVEHGSRVSIAETEAEADAVVVAAGSWAPHLLADEGIELPVRATRETVVYFKLGRPVPSILEIGRGDRMFHMYSLVDPVHGLKVGCHMSGAETDPDEVGVPDAAIVERVEAWARERFPDVGPAAAGTDTCLYTTTVDEEFVLERRGRVVVGSACSGHGFKFAPAVGTRLADLAIQSLG